MDKQKIKAFTLVELIVVITILAILGTIAFISLQGYSAQSRDSVRITDMASIKTGLELFQLDAGKYPLPSDETIITYSGATAWTQGYFGESVYKNLSKLDKIPTDPLTDKKYVYSTTSTRNEYQLAGAMEGDVVSFSPVAQKVEAAEKTAMLKITGSYNGKVLKVSTGSTNYVLAIPSIISATGATLETIVTNNLLAYNGYKNLPFEYSGIYKVDGETSLNLINSGSLIVYQGDLATLSDTSTTGIDARKLLIQKLQSAFSGTTIANIGEIQSILLTNINDTTSTENVSATLVNNNLGGNLAISTNSITGPWTALDPNCDIPDITIGSQTWAGCNSTLGNGVEWGKKDDGTDGIVASCYSSYDGTTNNTGSCVIGSTPMVSTTKANTWYTGINVNGDQEYPAIWGKLYTWTNTPTACPSGRHVPSDAEFETLETTLNGSNCRNSTNGFLCDGLGWKLHNTKITSNNIAQALKIPLAGFRNADGYNFSLRGLISLLWSSNKYDASNSLSRRIRSDNSAINRIVSPNILASSVRCLKGSQPTTCGTNYTWNGSSCEPNTQTSTCGGSIPSNATATTSSTYTQTWNGSTWISSSWGENQISCDFNCNSGYAWDGTSCVVPYPSGCTSPDITVGSYTISACNVGTTVAGTGTISYGNYFQWGNNGGTPSGNLTPSTTLVNASSYGPGNYYNNTTFIGWLSITSPYDWTSPQNDNLWGDTTNTSIARQGPCPSSYHVPSNSEWNGIIAAGGWGSSGIDIMNALKLPMAGKRYYGNGVIDTQGTYGFYWSSTPNSTNVYFLQFDSGTVYTNSNVRTYAFPIRCFKN